VVEIKLDVTKRFMIFSVILISIMGLFALSYAGNGQFNLPLAWVLDNNGQSVDSDNNGVIDNSDKVTGLSAADLSAVGTTSGNVLTNYVGIGVKNCAVGYNKAYDGIVAGQAGTTLSEQAKNSVAYIGAQSTGGSETFCVGSESSIDSSNTKYPGSTYHSFWSFRGWEYTGNDRVACVVCIKG